MSLYVGDTHVATKGILTPAGLVTSPADVCDSKPAPRDTEQHHHGGSPRGKLQTIAVLSSSGQLASTLCPPVIHRRQSTLTLIPDNADEFQEEVIHIIACRIRSKYGYREIEKGARTPHVEGSTPSSGGKRPSNVVYQRRRAQRGPQ